MYTYIFQCPMGLLILLYVFFFMLILDDGFYKIVPPLLAIVYSECISLNFWLHVHNTHAKLLDFRFWSKVFACRLMASTDSNRTCGFFFYLVYIFVWFLMAISKHFPQLKNFNFVSFSIRFYFSNFDFEAKCRLSLL